MTARETPAPGGEGSTLPPHSGDHPTTTDRDDDGQWWEFCYSCQRNIDAFPRPVAARETLRPDPLTPDPSDNSPDYNRGWADGQAAALDACQPVIDSLQAALRAATPDPAEPRAIDLLRKGAEHIGGDPDRSRNWNHRHWQDAVLAFLDATPDRAASTVEPEPEEIAEP